MTDYDHAIAKAAEIGAEHGHNAATWFETDNPAAILQMLEDGDPIVYHALPHPDLSGQWADGYTPRQLAEDCGYPENPAGDNPSWGDVADHSAGIDELCDAYEEAFSIAVEAEVDRVCRYHLTES